MRLRSACRKAWGFESLLGYTTTNKNKMTTKSRILISIAIALIVLAIALLVMKPEKPFTKVQLSNDNLVSNYTKYPYMDTIAYIGLDSLGMCEINLEIKKLTSQAKSNFDSGYELEGLIYGMGKNYIMWIDEGKSREEYIKIVCHELIHLRQYTSKQLVYDGFYVYWNRAKYDLKETDYATRPWEADAFENGVLLERKIRSVLY